jgi:ribosomal protein S18 acetylase RimI-like enzyme
MSYEGLLLTPAGRITIEQAQPSDLDTVLDILEEVAGWLTSRGIDQWQPGVFRRIRRQSIADQVSRGEVYLARRDGQPVGTLTLQWADKMFWGNVPDDAGYIHRLAIRRAYAGMELGCHLLRWAERKVASAGKDYLRLDCMAENQALRQYYEQAGFTSRGEIQGQGWKASLFEKKVTGEHA